MKISRLKNIYPFSDFFYEVPIVYRKPHKTTNLKVSGFEITRWHVDFVESAN